MKKSNLIVVAIVAGMSLLTSCRTLEKASMHGFSNGFYKLDSGGTVSEVYVDVSGENLDVYPQQNKTPDTLKRTSFSLMNSQTPAGQNLTFRKQSLDIDLTTILLKYRMPVSGLPSQLTSDLNIALYAGWRHDTYKFKSHKDPLGRNVPGFTNFGYDIGVFAGAGSTPVNPFTTRNRTANDYSGMILETGIAGFLESNIASFGIAAGFDCLLNNDRKIWVYHQKPWLGFIIGIALN